MNTNTTKTDGISLFRMLGAVLRLLRDPSDTAQVFETASAASLPALRRAARDLSESPEGRALLDERPSLADALLTTQASDFAPGTLGHEYHRFLEREGITTEGLAAMSGPAHGQLEGDARYFADRMLFQHDLWHALMGFEGDIIGEACLLAFTTRQTNNVGAGVIAAALYLVGGGKLGMRAMMREAYRRSGQAATLMVVRWEDHLHTPVTELREMLRLGEPMPYTPVRSDRLGKLGLFGPIAPAA